MPTIAVDTAGGGDFTTLHAALQSIPTDVTQDYVVTVTGGADTQSVDTPVFVFNGGSVTVQPADDSQQALVTGWDATRYHLSVTNDFAINVLGDINLDGLQLSIIDVSSAIRNCIKSNNPGTTNINACRLRVMGTTLDYVPMSCLKGVTKITNCIMEFEVPGQGGSGFEVRNPAVVDAYNCIVTGAGIFGFYLFASTTPTIRNCVAFNNTNSDVQNNPGYDISYCASDDLIPGPGSNNVNPLDWTAVFTDPANGDYSLKNVSSDLVDIGLTLPSVVDDMKGLSRPQNSLYDIGPDELLQGAPPPSGPDFEYTGSPYDVNYDEDFSEFPTILSGPIDSYRVVFGSLPSGLELAGPTGEIYGNVPSPMPIVSYPPLVGTVGEYMEVSPVSTGGLVQLYEEVDLLPEGLTIDPTSGLVAGTPLEAFTGTVRIAASNPTGTVIADLACDLTKAVGAWRAAGWSARGWMALGWEYGYNESAAPAETSLRPDDVYGPIPTEITGTPNDLDDSGQTPVDPSGLPPLPVLPVPPGPGPVVLDQADTEYQLQEDMDFDTAGIEIKADGIRLNGMGHRLTYNNVGPKKTDLEEPQYGYRLGTVESALFVEGDHFGITSVESGLWKTSAGDASYSTIRFLTGPEAGNVYQGMWNTPDVDYTCHFLWGAKEYFHQLEWQSGGPNPGDTFETYWGNETWGVYVNSVDGIAIINLDIEEGNGTAIASGYQWAEGVCPIRAKGTGGLIQGVKTTHHGPNAAAINGRYAYEYEYAYNTLIDEGGEDTIWVSNRDCPTIFGSTGAYIHHNRMVNSRSRCAQSGIDGVIEHNEMLLLARRQNASGTLTQHRGTVRFNNIYQLGCGGVGINIYGSAGSPCDENYVYGNWVENELTTLQPVFTSDPDVREPGIGACLSNHGADRGIIGNLFESNTCIVYTGLNSSARVVRLESVVGAAVLGEVYIYNEFAQFEKDTNYRSLHAACVAIGACDTKHGILFERNRLIGTGPCVDTNFDSQQSNNRQLMVANTLERYLYDARFYYFSASNATGSGSGNTEIENISSVYPGLSTPDYWAKWEWTARDVKFLIGSVATIFARDSVGNPLGGALVEVMDAFHGSEVRYSGVTGADGKINTPIAHDMVWSDQTGSGRLDQSLNQIAVRVTAGTDVVTEYFTVTADTTLTVVVGDATPNSFAYPPISQLTTGDPMTPVNPIVTGAVTGYADTGATSLASEGLALDTATGQLTGTPTSSGAKSFEVTATFADASEIVEVIPITVNDPGSFTSLRRGAEAGYGDIPAEITALGLAPHNLSASGQTHIDIGDGAGGIQSHNSMLLTYDNGGRTNRIDIDQTDVTDDGILLTQTDTEYRLTGDLVFKTRGLVVSSRDITVNLNGYTITYGNEGCYGGSTGTCATTPYEWPVASRNPAATKVRYSAFLYSDDMVGQSQGDHKLKILRFTSGPEAGNIYPTNQYVEDLVDYDDVYFGSGLDLSLVKGDWTTLNYNILDWQNGGPNAGDTYVLVDPRNTYGIGGTPVGLQVINGQIEEGAGWGAGNTDNSGYNPINASACEYVGGVAFKYSAWATEACNASATVGGAFEYCTVEDLGQLLWNRLDTCVGVRIGTDGMFQRNRLIDCRHQSVFGKAGGNIIQYNEIAPRGTNNANGSAMTFRNNPNTVFRFNNIYSWGRITHGIHIGSESANYELIHDNWIELCSYAYEGDNTYGPAGISNRWGERHAANKIFDNVIIAWGNTHPDAEFTAMPFCVWSGDAEDQFHELYYDNIFCAYTLDGTKTSCISLGCGKNDDKETINLVYVANTFLSNYSFGSYGDSNAYPPGKGHSRFIDINFQKIDSAFWNVSFWNGAEVEIDVINPTFSNGGSIDDWLWGPNNKLRECRVGYKVLVTVVDSDGLPVEGAAVTVTDTDGVLMRGPEYFNPNPGGSSTVKGYTTDANGNVTVDTPVYAITNKTDFTQDPSRSTLVPITFSAVAGALVGSAVMSVEPTANTAIEITVS